jgi:hypothetical protein
VTILAVSLFSIGKSWLRMKAVELVLTGHRKAIRKQFVPQLTLWAITPAVFFFNCAAALFSRHISWRGSRYVLVSNSKTSVLHKNL